MRYVKVKWLHDNPDYPVLLLSELDAEMWEVRKVEIYADGRKDFADRNERSGSTKLGIEPFSSEEFDAIAADPQFQPMLISAKEFEIEWQQARGMTGRIT